MKSVYVYIIGYEKRQEQFDHIDYIRHYSIFCSNKLDISFYNHECYNSQVNFVLKKDYNRFYFKDDKLLNADGETRSLIQRKDSSEINYNTVFNLSAVFLKQIDEKYYFNNGRFMLVFKANINAILIGESIFRICNDNLIKQKKYLFNKVEDVCFLYLIKKY